MKKGLPLKVGQPRDRQLVVATHEMALNETAGSRLSLREGVDHEDSAVDPKKSALTFAAEPGKVAHFGRSRSSATRASGKPSSAAS